MTSKSITMDMTTTRPEFDRCLEVALRGMTATIDGAHISVDDHGKKVELKLSPLPPRELSQTLKLERWQLIVQFGDQSSGERQKFMDTSRGRFIEVVVENSKILTK